MVRVEDPGFSLTSLTSLATEGRDRKGLGGWVVGWLGGWVVRGLAGLGGKEGEEEDEGLGIRILRAEGVMILGECCTVGWARSIFGDRSGQIQVLDF